MIALHKGNFAPQQNRFHHEQMLRATYRRSARRTDAKNIVQMLCAVCSAFAQRVRRSAQRVSYSAHLKRCSKS